MQMLLTIHHSFVSRTNYLINSGSGRETLRFVVETKKIYGMSQLKRLTC
jgi:hypothetical protein